MLMVVTANLGQLIADDNPDLVAVARNDLVDLLSLAGQGVNRSKQTHISYTTNSVYNIYTCPGDS